MDVRICYCASEECECTDDTHGEETQTSITHETCTDHWMRVAYAKSPKRVGWLPWYKMTTKVMENLADYFWNFGSFAEYTTAWEQEMQELEENNYPTRYEDDHKITLWGYLEDMKQLVKAGFNPHHSYDAKEGMWMWA